jgi:hypothetical protein
MVIIVKYIVSGMKYETGIAIGLRAVTEAANIDQRNVKNRLAIKNVNKIVARKKTELMDLVQV